jgi:hypothetical protein
MRGSALAGSLAVHCAIALPIVLLLTGGPARRPGQARGGITVEVLDATRPASSPSGSPRVDPAPPGPEAAHTPALPQAEQSPQAARPLHTTAPRPPRTIARGHGTPMQQEAVETTMRMEEQGGAGDGDVASGSGPGGSGPGGSGPGDGPGAGLGLGDGNGIANLAAVASLPLPVPPRVSLARPPRLIWPTRDEPLIESALYVARLTIDTDGLVDGVRLVHRHRLPRDNEAESAVWTFRYLPALDDDGHPTRVTIEQPFMLRMR